ncbi:MAG: division plane positioning ATPase MipZ [Holosporaceae bacterium]|jgi:chromosome partitioning protein|nr:division plane positioning ATPase MipZ [Holosporaceae bacterium]
MKPYVIVLGNEKGGTGKSTMAMHVAVYLLNDGFKVGTIDVDARQGTFTRYFEHRKNAGENVKLPEHIAIPKDNNNDREKAKAIDNELFNAAMDRLKNHDFIVIDTPGNDTPLSQLSHSHADALVTPLNDSFVDLDVLVKVSGNGMKILSPSIYAEMVWNQRKERAKRGEKPIDWIVIRNRLTTLYNKNRRDINVVLEALSKRIGFRLGTGFCERVIFKELFLSGLTLLDLEKSGVPLNISHISARQELRELINFMKLPNL